MTDRQVEGVNLDDLEEIYKKFEDAVTAALAAAMHASLKGGALAAESVAQVSLDDLNVIPGQWARQVPALADHLTEIYVKSADMQADAFVRAGGVVTEELARSDAATIDYLAQASNRLVGIGDDLWADARSELLLGMDAGDSVPQLARRVRESTGVTDKRARVIARSEAVSASNCGSIAFMRSTGEVADKRWLNHVDARTRESHLTAGGQTVPIGAKFVVGGALLDHPGDPNGPPSETIQCRCVCEWILTSESATAQSDSGGDTLAASAQEDAVTVVELPTVYASDFTREDSVLVAALSAMENTAPWEGVICVTGQPTGDRRQFDSLTWADLPLPLRRNVVESHGGLPQTQAVLVGRIDAIEMRANEVWASGVIDLGSTDGREAARLMGTRDNPGFLRGVSIDGDETPGEPSTIEHVFPADCAQMMALADGEPSMEDMARCMEPELSIWSSARIRGATLTDIPALSQANLYLTDGVNMPYTVNRMEEPMAASIEVNEPTMADVVESLTAAAATIVIPDLPPAWWFDEPEVPEIGGITITDSGRIFGYLAPAGVQHRSYAGSGKRVTVPMGKVDYSRFMNRATIVANDDGTSRRIATGPVTMSCGHAPTTGPLARSSAASMEVYDNSCSIFATICVGENRGGVWVAGAVLPDVTASQLARALACQLSGDWRPHSDRQGGWREMIAALMVPCPGFPVANRGARVSMQGDALVASAVPVNFTGETECAPCAVAAEFDGGSGAEVSSLASVRAADILSAKVGRDRVSRAAELTRLVRG